MTRDFCRVPTNDSHSGEAVGIDDLSVYVPGLFLPLAGEFSLDRGIDPGKLIKGIGIERMAVPDAHEDAATMAAMSLLDLMRRCDLVPEDIGKIYVGTESAVDEAKAMGTYVIGMLEKVYGKGSFQDCSTVEFKSACIGTTFALESLSYWAAAEEEDKVGIVIASDVAKYPLRFCRRVHPGSGKRCPACEKETPARQAGADLWMLHQGRERLLPAYGMHNCDCQWKAQQPVLSGRYAGSLRFVRQKSRSIRRNNSEGWRMRHRFHGPLPVPYPLSKNGRVCFGRHLQA